MLTRIISAVAASLFLVMALPSTPQEATPPAAGTLACRALETHTGDGLKIAVVVFHQRGRGGDQKECWGISRHIWLHGE